MTVPVPNPPVVENEGVALKPLALVANALNTKVDCEPLVIVKVSTTDGAAK